MCAHTSPRFSASSSAPRGARIYFSAAEHGDKKRRYRSEFWRHSRFNQKPSRSGARINWMETGGADAYLSFSVRSKRAQGKGMCSECCFLQIHFAVRARRTKGIFSLTTPNWMWYISFQKLLSADFIAFCLQFRGLNRVFMHKPCPGAASGRQREINNCFNAPATKEDKNHTNERRDFQWNEKMQISREEFHYLRASESRVRDQFSELA